MPTPTYHFFVAKYSQLLAYGFLVVLMVFALWQVQRQQNALTNEIEARTTLRNEQALALCTEAMITREGLRNQIIAISRLGQSLVGDDEPGDAQKRDRFIEFEKNELENLPPITCPREGDTLVNPQVRDSR